MIRKFIYIFTLVSFISAFTPAYSQNTNETLRLKQEVSNLSREIKEQKAVTSALQERINILIETQNSLITDLTKTINIIQTIPQTSSTSNNTFKDAFILNKSGKPIAFIDAGLKLYEYYGGNLIGKINPTTNEIIRNYDGSVIAIIENDFLIGEDGYAIGSVERSETLKWDREKLDSQVQKTPISHFFVMTQASTPFNLTPFRYSDWSDKDLEELLLFSEKKIHKLK